MSTTKHELALIKNDAAVTAIEIQADYARSREAARLLGIQLGAFMVYDQTRDWFTFYDQNTMVRTRSLCTVLLHLVTLAGETAVEA